jgi:SAM-dependent methyltransferase
MTVAAARRRRRRPSRTQHDYLQLRRLADDLERVLSALPQDSPRVLDLFCGMRPYEDLLPAGARVTGLDITDEFGLADVVTRDFLPFDDDAFDVVLCTQAFYYVPDPARAAAELLRVLRPGGELVITVPHVQEYAREGLEHRFTGPELAELFAAWEDLSIQESGGRAVSWATISGRYVLDAERALAGTAVPAPVTGLLARGACLLVNGAGVLLEALDRRIGKPGYALPCNLLLHARAPGGPAAP